MVGIDTPDFFFIYKVCKPFCGEHCFELNQSVLFEPYNLPSFNH